MRRRWCNPHTNTLWARLKAQFTQQWFFGETWSLPFTKNGALTIPTSEANFSQMQQPSPCQQFTRSFEWRCTPCLFFFPSNSSTLGPPCCTHAVDSTWFSETPSAKWESAGAFTESAELISPPLHWRIDIKRNRLVATGGAGLGPPVFPYKPGYFLKKNLLPFTPNAEFCLWAWHFPKSVASPQDQRSAEMWQGSSGFRFVASYKVVLAHLIGTTWSCITSQEPTALWQ